MSKTSDGRCSERLRLSRTGYHLHRVHFVKQLFVLNHQMLVWNNDRVSSPSLPQPDGARWETEGNERITVMTKQEPVGQVWLSKEPMFKQSMPVPKPALNCTDPCSCCVSGDSCEILMVITIRRKLSTTTLTVRGRKISKNESCCEYAFSFVSGNKVCVQFRKCHF